METNVWGPSAWKFLHTITFQYPENPTDIEKRKYYVFFNSLKDVLPCPNCREHYSEHFNKIPIQMESRKELIEWLIDIHNEVNQKNGKRVLQYEEVYKKYNEIYDVNTPSKLPTFNIAFSLMIILLIVIIYYYYVIVQFNICSIYLFKYLLSMSPKCLKLNKSSVPAINKTKNNNISNKFFSIGQDPPIYAIGMDPTKYGINNLKFKLPAFI